MLTFVFSGHPLEPPLRQTLSSLARRLVLANTDQKSQCRKRDLSIHFAALSLAQLLSHTHAYWMFRNKIIASGIEQGSFPSVCFIDRL